MYYIAAIQIVCGFFCAHVAAGKGRSTVAWWLVGAFLPVVGVVLVLLASDKTRSDYEWPPESAATARKLQRPKRCCGAYIPDCLGCPYFRRPLFQEKPEEGLRGTCDYFGRDLLDSRTADTHTSELTLEER